MNWRSLLCASILASAAVFARDGARAADVELLPPSLMAPSSTDQVPAGKFKKDPPWVIGMSFAFSATMVAGIDATRSAM